MTNEFTILEAAGGRPRVAGTAYSGGKMNLSGWRHPVVVDLSGMEIPESVPLLTNHENRTDARVGMVRAKAEGGALLIEGEILSDGETANGIVAQGKAGADWQLSIGADVRESELVKGRAEVNGMAQDGPFHCVRRSVLREVSVDGCPVIGRGYYGTVYRLDADTIVKVYASPDSIPLIEIPSKTALRRPYRFEL